MQGRTRKVERIFRQFDRNCDGRLSRDEMAALVIAVNPRVKFSDEQIRAILDEVFRTYGEFIDGDRGLSLDGLLRTYDDGAGDVDRDFDALGLQLEDGGGATTDAESSLGEESRGSAEQGGGAAGRAVAVSIMDERPDAGRRRQNVGAWASSPNNGIAYDDTWRIVEDLEIVLRRANTKVEARRRAKNGAGGGGDAPRFMHELGSESTAFQKEVGELRQRADSSRTQEEAFDAHMAMGRSLSDHRFYEEALTSFKRATELKPSDVRPHFRAGNTLYSLGRPAEAQAAYELALEATQSGSQQWAGLAPQVHVNLGIALEEQGLLLNACEHYREAAILHPAHYRALKLLGSALLGVAEYRAAEKALGEAVFLRPDYADAHCDLGSALHSLGEEDRAAAELQRAIDLDPDHVEALYNLGGLLRDAGSFQQAADVYARVLTLRPGHWQAQLNRAVSLLGAGDVEAARQALKEALRMTSRLEVYDTLGHLKLMRRLGGGDTVPSTVVEASRFTTATGSTTPRQWMAQALAIRSFQKLAGLDRCPVSSLASEMESGRQLPLSQAAGGVSEKLIRKADLERSLWRLLGGGGPAAFAAAVKAVNERVLGALDRSGSGRIDFGMFLASLAPICGGGAERRKRVAFDCLVWRSSRDRLGAEVVRSDVKAYLRQLRAVYMPSEAASSLWEVHGDDEHSTLSYPEFVTMFDDPDWGFGILSTLIRLESGGDRVRHAGIACAVCACFPITGPRFKELRLGFNLCAMCYSEGKVPAAKQLNDSYAFKEYATPGGAMRDKLCFRSRSPPALPPPPAAAS